MMSAPDELLRKLDHEHLTLQEFREVLHNLKNRPYGS